MQLVGGERVVVGIWMGIWEGDVRERKEAGAGRKEGGPCSVHVQ